MEKQYYNTYKRGKKQWCYINSKALGWDVQNWLFSSGQNRQDVAMELTKRVYKIAKANPKDFDYKTTVKTLRAEIKQSAEKADIIYTVEHMIFDRLELKKVKACEACKPQSKSKENISFPFLFATPSAQPKITMKKNEKTCSDCENEPKKRSYETLRGQLQHFLDFNGEIPAQRLSIKYLKDYIDYMKKKKTAKDKRKYSDATIETSLDYLKTCFMQALENDKIQKNQDIKKIIRFRKHLNETSDYKLKPNIRPDTFTDDKLQELLKVCDNEPLKIMLKIASNYPTRFTELRKLRLDRFEIRNNVGFLTFPDPMKKGEKRDISVNDEIRDLLKELKESKTSEQYFFTDKNGKLISGSTIKTAFYRARAKADITDCFHQLRIRATTDCFRAGLPLKIIMILGGWKRETTCMRYYQPSDYDLAEIGKTIEDYKKRAYGKI